MTRAEATERILAAKKQKGVTFEAIAKAVGRHKVWVTSALLGQSTMSAEEAQKALVALGLGPDVAAALQEIPTKGSVGQTVPVDPLIYRFHEITQVYGTTIKALIHEMFGDGIMSAIDFETSRAALACQRPAEAVQAADLPGPPQTRRGVRHSCPSPCSCCCRLTHKLSCRAGQCLGKP